MKFEKLHILNIDLYDQFKQQVDFDVLDAIQRTREFNMPVDYFQFYKSVSSVYSSKIEGEDIEFDSFFKHKFLNVQFQADYTQRADDLLEAYDFIDDHPISLENLKKAHAIITRHLLPESQRGLIRRNPMFVLNNEDKIEYVAAESAILDSELEKLFVDIQQLLDWDLEIEAVFYFASLIHLVFVKIHPFQDGNGRTARLLEKWFLLQKLGIEATGIQLEKNYYQHLSDYYFNIKKLGLEYDTLNYMNASNFLLMTILGLKNQTKTN